MRPVPLTHDGMVTAAQLAELTGKSVKTVYAWTARGLKLPTGERWHLPVAGITRIAGDRVRLYRLEDAATAHHAVTARGTSNTNQLAA